MTSGNWHLVPHFNPSTESNFVLHDAASTQVPRSKSKIGVVPLQEPADLHAVFESLGPYGHGRQNLVVFMVTTASLD